MKKILFLLVFVSMLVFSFNFVAGSENEINVSETIEGVEGRIGSLDETLDNEILVPGQFGYGFKKFTESVRLFFTFSEEARIEYRMELANRRNMEIRRVLFENKTEYIEELVEGYGERIEEIEESVERLRERKRGEVQERVANMTQRHSEVLQEVLDEVPEDARKGIENAINVSQEGHIRAREAIAKRQGKNESEIGQIGKDLREQFRRRDETQIDKEINNSEE